MKRIINWAMALIIIGGSSLLAACSSDDNSSSESPAAAKNREMLATHFKTDTAVLDENLNANAVDMSTQAISQLLMLMGKSRYFKEDMQKMLLMLTIQNAADRSTSHGLRVVFDERGNYKVGTGDGMAFIFPAVINGYDGTLYKLSMKSNANWDEVPTALNVTLSCMYGDREVVLCKSETNIKKNSDYPSFVALTLGAFNYDSKVAYSLPDTREGACTMNIVATRTDDGTVNVTYGYVQNALNILKVAITSHLPVDYVINTIEDAMAQAMDKKIDASMLDDLFIKGDVDDNMVITCGKEGNGVPMRFEKVQDGDITRRLPAFALDYTSAYTPLKGVVDAETYDSIVNLYDRAVVMAHESSTAYSDLLLMLMQILPVGGVK